MSTSSHFFDPLEFGRRVRMVLKELIDGIESVYLLNGNSTEQNWLAVVNPRVENDIKRSCFCKPVAHRNFNFKTTFSGSGENKIFEIKIDNRTAAELFKNKLLGELPRQYITFMRIDGEFILKKELTSAFTVLASLGRKEVMKNKDVPYICDILE